MLSSPPSIVVVVSSVPPLIPVHPIVAVVIVPFIVHYHEPLSSPSAFLGFVAATKIHVAEEHEQHDCPCAEESILGYVIVLVEEGEQLIIAEVGRLAVIDVSKSEDEVGDVVGSRAPEGAIQQFFDVADDCEECDFWIGDVGANAIFCIFEAVLIYIPFIYNLLLFLAIGIVVAISRFIKRTSAIFLTKHYRRLIVHVCSVSDHFIVRSCAVPVKHPVRSKHHSDPQPDENHHEHYDEYLEHAHIS